MWWLMVEAKEEEDGDCVEVWDGGGVEGGGVMATGRDDGNRDGDGGGNVGRRKVLTDG